MLTVSLARIKMALAVNKMYAYFISTIIGR